MGHANYGVSLPSLQICGEFDSLPEDCILSVMLLLLFLFFLFFFFCCVLSLAIVQ